jgi:hypothetical protein
VPQAHKHSSALIVLNSRGARVAGQQLVMDGVSANAILFASRPARGVGHMHTSDLAAMWTTGSFAKDPPNATLSVFHKDGSNVADVVVVLKAPKLEGDKLTFDVQVLDGDLAGADGPASVFVDLFNLPLTRRTGHRSAWYAGAQQH